MAARAVRLCAVFLGGGTVFLGAGISYSGLAKYKRKGKIFFDESFCETSQDNEPHPREKVLHVCYNTEIGGRALLDLPSSYRELQT